ncbi:MAG: hypothetical protein AAF192_03290 [Pseudomonadota bacterium]
MQDLKKLLALDRIASRSGVALKPELAEAIRETLTPPPPGVIPLPVRAASSGPARQTATPEHLDALGIPRLDAARRTGRDRALREGSA